MSSNEKMQLVKIIYCTFQRALSKKFVFFMTVKSNSTEPGKVKCSPCEILKPGCIKFQSTFKFSDIELLNFESLNGKLHGKRKS